MTSEFHVPSEVYKLSQVSHTLFTIRVHTSGFFCVWKHLTAKMSSPTSSTTPATPYDIQERDILFSNNTRYMVTDFSGEGYFGRVAKCVNLTTQEQVAVKIHKDDEGYFIRNELEMLEAIRTLDPDKSNIVRFFEGFRFHNLSCLTFEILDKSLVDVMREQQRTMHLNEIRPITHQLLVAFDALKSIGIIHLDLKPDNIMFSNHKDHPFKLKLIDFGLAQRVNEVQAAMIIQPFSYQAPEVGLGLPLSEAMDMWGVGCVMAFMYFGANLLPYHCPYDWMRTIVHLLGQPEEHLLNAGENTSTYFIKNDDGSPEWRLKSSDEYLETTGVEAEVRHRIFDYAENLDDAVQSYPEERKDVEYKDRMAFLSLLKSCLNLDPQARATPSEAIMNPFISMVHLVEVMAMSSHAEEALQIMYDSHLKDLDDWDDSLSDSGMDSDFEHTEDRSSDADSCIGEDSLSGYDADCSDDSSIDEDPHTSADSANVESSADEDVIIQPSSMRCSDSLPPTPLCGEDVSSSSNGHSDGEMFNLDMSAGLSAISSSHDSVSERSILSHQESGAAPTSPQIYEVTDCGPTASDDNTSAAVDQADGAAANISTNDEAAAAAQPTVQKRFRSVRKFFSRIRRRVVSFFNN